MELSPEEKTMRKVQELANLLVQGIRFTIDLPGRHTSGKVPMLDLAVWLDDSDVKVIRHTYYEKPTTSPLVFHGRGACSVKQKIMILSEEVRRRLYNQDPQHSLEERARILEMFSQKLVDSGYAAEIRKEILESGIKRYFRMRLNEVAKIRNLYRTPEEMKTSRNQKQKATKAWFKPRRGGQRSKILKDYPINYPGK